MFFNLCTTCKSRGRWIGSSAPGWGRAYAGMHEGHALKISDYSPNQTRPSQHFLCSTGSGPDYNFINSGCSFYNAPQILAKGVGFSVANPQFLALSPHPLGGALLNEGEGRPTILIRRRRNIVNIGRRRLFGCFPFRCKYCEWELK